MIEWIEPFGPSNEPVFCRVLPETAIAYQRRNALQAKNYEYESDEAALEDFMIVHWASKIDTSA